MVELVSIAGVPARVQGPPHVAITVLALHGWGRSKRDWNVDSPNVRVYSVDLPGHGNAELPDSPWGAREYAQWLEPILKEIGPCVLAGHSFGGRIALCATAMFPDRVTGLALSGVPFFHSASTHPPVALRWRKGLNRLRLYSDVRLDRYRYEKGSEDYRRARGVMRSVLVRTVNEDYTNELGMIQCPVLMFWGSDDTAAPPELARRAVSLVSVTCRLVFCDGDHFAIHTDSGRFWTELVEMFGAGG